MTDQEINIKIAELCGWTYQPTAVAEYIWIAPNKEGFKRPPNYAADLNACHEFEKTLSATQQAFYLRFLQLGGPAFMATARQRCEAFLRVLNLLEAGDIEQAKQLLKEELK